MDNSKFLFENTSAEINNAPTKATPVNADKVGIWDSVTGLLNGLTWANLLATAKAYFDTLYITTAYSPVPTRQTVFSGPTVASGAAIVPNFLAATYPSLVVTTQNVGTGLNRLIATASSGDSDLKGYSSIDLVWPACTANLTNYLFCNVSGGALIPVAPTILPPIYQDGGTPSIVNGQYTYNIQEHTMYLGNGATAPAVNHVEFARVVAGAATITATVPYAYQGRYDSGYTNGLPISTQIQKNHNIGSDRVKVSLYIEAIANDGDYVIGDELEGSNIFNSVAALATLPFSISFQALTMSVRFGTGVYVWAKTLATLPALVNASWKYKLVAWRDWN